MKRPFVLFFLMLLCLACPRGTQGHGRLVEPPSRSSMWRFGFKTEPNYNDNELFCGGYTVHWQRHGGKCGVCGDPWHAPQPRPNEAGGKYGKGIIVRRYSQGQGITASVQLTANHNGFFEFKLCPNNNPKRVVQQECLDRYPLNVEGTSESRYYVPDAKTRTFDVRLKLPDDVTCTQCVFQWTYTAGNNWGTCEDGTGKVGCGPQETFRGCADVAIDGGDQTNEASSHHVVTGHAIRPGSVYVNQTFPFAAPSSTPSSSWQKPFSTRPTLKPTLVFKATSKPTQKTTFKVGNSRPTWKPSSTFKVPLKATTAKPSYKPNIKTSIRPWTTSRPSITKIPFKKVTPTSGQVNTLEDKNRSRKCKGVGVWKRLPGIDGWCDINCARGYCPSTHCLCG